MKATILIGMCCTGAILANSVHLGLKSAAVGVVAGSIAGNLINKAIEKFKIIKMMLDQWLFAIFIVFSVKYLWYLLQFKIFYLLYLYLQHIGNLSSIKITKKTNNNSI